MSILKMLASESFITVNKEIAQVINIDASVLVGHFASLQNYHRGLFYQTFEQIENATTLSKYKATNAIKELKNRGYLKVQKKGIPCKTFYELDIDKMGEIFNDKESKDLTTRSEETERQEVKKFDDKKSKNLTTVSQKTERQEVKKLDDYYKDNKNTINKNKDNKYSSAFEKFWDCYPRKTDKRKAYQVWKSKIKARELPELPEHIEIVNQWSKTEQWKEKRYIPHPSTWLRNNRWEDELPPRASPPSQKPKMRTEFKEVDF